MRASTKLFRLLPSLPLLCSADDSSGMLDFYICSNSNVQVTSIQMLCDSPGTYYYGSSNSYRKSESCKFGDYVNFALTFDIDSDLSDTGVYVTANILGNGLKVPLYSAKNLCAVSSLKADDGQDCPEQGSYSVQSKFVLSDSTGQDDGSTSFSPDIVMAFSSDGADDNVDYGCVNMDDPEEDDEEEEGNDSDNGGSFINLSSDGGSSFMAQNGLLLFTVIFMGGFILFLYWRQPRQKGYGQSIYDDDKKVELVGKNSDVVDF